MRQFTFLCSLILLISCQQVYRSKKGATPDNKQGKMSWILGTWQMQTPEGVITEEWTSPTDSSWQGVSFMVTRSGDTPFREKIVLDFHDDTLYYRPAVEGQNGGMPVSFREKSFSDDMVVFENLRHEFPQRIIYKRTSDTTIIATIEGNEGGIERKEEFSYTKTP